MSHHYRILAGVFTVLTGVCAALAEEPISSVNTGAINPSGQRLTERANHRNPSERAHSSALSLLDEPQLINTPTASALGAIESTGFEVGDGWSTGFICGPNFASCSNPDQNCDIANPNPATDWYLSTSAQSCDEPHIDIANPYAGSQHFRFTRDPALCIGYSGACRQTAFTPEFADHHGPTTISFQAAAGGPEGSYFQYWALNGNQFLAQIELGSDGYIWIWDVNLQDWVFPSVAVAASGVYKELRIELDPCGNHIDYYYGGVHIYSGAHTFARIGFTRAVFVYNNGFGNFDIDDYAVVRGSACPAGSCGNNTTEFGEDCDGTDVFACETGLCSDSCHCVEYGACCDAATELCTENVLETNCNAPGQTHWPQTSCCEAECRPADVPYDASNVTLLGHVPLSGFTDTFPTFANEVWGYVSPSGREYAIFGLDCAFAFVEVTDPVNPQVIAEIPGPCSIWRDSSVYRHPTMGDFVYGVIDATGDGLYVMDISQIDSGIVSLANLVNPSGFALAHNIDVNQDSGFAYAVSTNIGGGLVALDLNTNPVSPTVAGTWNGDNVHDVQVLTMPGGAEIAFAAGLGTGMNVVDVTNKAGMFVRSVATYPWMYTPHQGWISEDYKYFFFGDESDEAVAGVTTTTHVIDIQDLDNAFLTNSFTNGRCAIDHNMMVRGYNLYEANYSTGLRVYNVHDVFNVSETGYFDTHPAHNFTNFDGAWGVYARLPSGNILVSDDLNGLFILDASEASNGACCDNAANSCTDNVMKGDCAGGDQVWTMGGRCEDFLCAYEDCNANGVVDSDEIADCDGEPECGDCNENGMPDGCDYNADSATFNLTFDLGIFVSCFEGPDPSAYAGPLDDCCQRYNAMADDVIDLRDVGQFLIHYAAP